MNHGLLPIGLLIWLCLSACSNRPALEPGRVYSHSVIVSKFTAVGEEDVLQGSRMAILSLAGTEVCERRIADRDGNAFVLRCHVLGMEAGGAMNVEVAVSGDGTDFARTVFGAESGGGGILIPRKNAAGREYLLLIQVGVAK